MSEGRHAYAIVDGAGELVHLTLAESADDVWQIYLGWPTKGEVKEAKARGLKCKRVTVTVE